MSQSKELSLTTRQFQFTIPSRRTPVLENHGITLRGDLGQANKCARARDHVQQWRQSRLHHARHALQGRKNVDGAFERNESGWSNCSPFNTSSHLPVTINTIASSSVEIPVTTAGALTPIPQMRPLLFDVHRGRTLRAGPVREHLLHLNARWECSAFLDMTTWVMARAVITAGVEPAIATPACTNFWGASRSLTSVASRSRNNLSPERPSTPPLAPTPRLQYRRAAGSASGNRWREHGQLTPPPAPDAACAIPRWLPRAGSRSSRAAACQGMIRASRDEFPLLG